MNPLSEEETRIILGKGTEEPFSGEYDNFYKDGTYICRHCNALLFSAKSKFDAGCGWPSFDETLPAGRQGFPEAVKRIPDANGRRTEIQCANCRGHLGHVFLGEQMTEKDTRHCVNSLSIKFIPIATKLPKVITE